MPHVTDVMPTSHDRHDAMLVAALAAGDLAATDRDPAIALTTSCAECASLRDDLIAIAAATATVPPPVTIHGRDFRLTPADAARLRPGGWRRLVAAFGTPRLAITRPLGIGLTTLGLVGLLIGNVSLDLGRPAAGTSTEGASSQDLSAGGVRAAASTVPIPVASGAPAIGPISAPAASAAAPAPSIQTNPDGASVGNGSEAAPASGGIDVAGGPFDAAATSAVKSSTNRELTAAGADPAAVAPTVDASRPLNVLFIAALVLGLAILVVSRRRSRPIA